MTTEQLAKILLVAFKQFVNTFAKEIGEEVTCQRCRKIEKHYHLVPKQKDTKKE